VGLTAPPSSTEPQSAPSSASMTVSRLPSRMAPQCSSRPAPREHRRAGCFRSRTRRALRVRPQGQRTEASVACGLRYLAEIADTRFSPPFLSRRGKTQEDKGSVEKYSEPATAIAVRRNRGRWPRSAPDVHTDQLPPGRSPHGPPRTPLARGWRSRGMLGRSGALVVAPALDTRLVATSGPACAGRHQECSPDGRTARGTR
jgi:hypothetical protein